MPKARVGFVLLSNSCQPQPSTRVSVLNMLPFLRAAGFDAQIVHEPDQTCECPDLSGLDARALASRFDIVYFQKVHGPAVQLLAQQLRAAGMRTVFGMCDRIRPDMTEVTDATVVVTEYLRLCYPEGLRNRIHVVHDGIERPQARRTAPIGDRGSARRPLQAVLVTSSALASLPVLVRPPPWLRVNIVGRYAPRRPRLRRWAEYRWRFAELDGLQRLDYLRFLTDRRIERVAWDPQRVYEQMQAADIGIIPVDARASSQPGEAEPDWALKSENRLTMKMAMGLPVIATPIPSYLPVVDEGRNAFLARHADEWFAQLEALRDPDRRTAIGARARASVLERYSMAAQARALTTLLDSL